MRTVLNCLEEHYGTLSGAIVQPHRAVAAPTATRAKHYEVRDLI